MTPIGKRLHENARQQDEVRTALLRAGETLTAALTAGESTTAARASIAKLERRQADLSEAAEAIGAEALADLRVRAEAHVAAKAAEISASIAAKMAALKAPPAPTRPGAHQ